MKLNFAALLVTALAVDVTVASTWFGKTGQCPILLSYLCLEGPVLCYSLVTLCISQAD